MLNFISEALTYVFPGGRVLKLVKGGVNITSSTNPLILAKNITVTVVECCSPPPIRLAAHCIGATTVIVASIASPNPVTIGSAIHLVGELYEKC